MFRWNRFGRALAALGLAAVLLAPLAARAEDVLEPPTGESPVGVVFAVICGASFSIARFEPLPIVVAVGAAACFGMLVDAMATPDP